MSTSDEQTHITISARVPIGLANALTDAAVAADRTFSAELRRAIKRYLVSEGVPIELRTTPPPIVDEPALNAPERLQRILGRRP